MIASIFSDWAVIFAAVAVLVAATGVMAWISNRVRKQEETNDSAVDMFLREDSEVVKPYNSVAEALTAALEYEKKNYPKGTRQNPDYSTDPWCPNCGSHALDRQPNSYMLRYCKSCGYYFTGATPPPPKIISKAQLKKEIEEERRMKRAMDEETMKQSPAAPDDSLLSPFMNGYTAEQDSPLDTKHDYPDFGGGSFGGGGGGDSYDPPSHSSHDSGSSYDSGSSSYDSGSSYDSESSSSDSSSSSSDW